MNLPESEKPIVDEKGVSLAAPSFLLQVDAIIYDLQSRAGISVYTEETVSALSAFGDIAIEYSVSPEARAKISNTVPPELIREQRRRSFERLRSFRLSDTGPTPVVFHSSYYRLPSDSVPTVVTLHDLIHEQQIPGWRSKILAFQKYQALRRADAIIAISQSTKSDLVKYYPEFGSKRIEVIYNGVSDDFIPPEEERRARRLVFVGSRKHYKNFGFAVKVMERLPGLEFHIVGGGALSKQEHALLERCLKGRYLLRGAICQEELIRLYQTSLGLFYPSRYEGFGLPALEAMKSGCIPIAFNTSSLPEVLGEAGILLDSEDVDEAAKRIASEIFSVGYPELQSRGFSQADRFSWAKTARSMYALYKSLI